MKTLPLLYIHSFYSTKATGKLTPFTLPPVQMPHHSLTSDIETLVVLQVPQVRETLPTLVAHKLFLPGVYLLVGFQAVALVEATSTCVAGERLLPSVDPLVSVQVAHVAETFPTCVAAERFLSCVDHLWRDKSFSNIGYTIIKSCMKTYTTLGFHDSYVCVCVPSQIH